MAATPLTVTALARAGITDTLAAANVDGHTIVNPADNMWLEVANADGTSTNVIIAVTKTVDGLAVASRTVAVAAAARKKIGPWPAASYGTTVTVTFSKVTALTVGAFSLS